MGPRPPRPDPACPLGFPSSAPPHLGYIVRCYGEEVHLVGQPLRGLHCGNVGVDEQCLDVLLLQGLDRLSGQGRPISLDCRSKAVESPVGISFSLLSSLYS